MLNPQPILTPPRAVGEVDGQQRDVRDALVAFVLEVVLGQPERLVPERVGGLRASATVVSNASITRSFG